MQYFKVLRNMALAIPAAAALAVTGANANIDETYWYASGGPTVPDGQLWATSYGECWQSAAPDGPANLPPCAIQPAAPLVLRLNFALDRYGLNDIINPDALSDLDAYIEEVKATPRDEMLTIVGHTDKLGSFEHNLVLSENRADTIRNYMIDRGISPDRIQSLKGVAWEGGNDVAADGSFIDLGPLENNPLRRRVVVTEIVPGA
jgi:OmpA-OmpF porin, OOP family